MHEQTLDALRRGANDEAVAAARADVAAAPADAKAYRMLAIALRASGDADAARAAIDRAIALAPDDADLHFHRAGLLLGARDVAQAQAALAQSVALDPNQFGAYVMQAQLALGRGDVDEAERIGRLSARLAPEHPWQMTIEGMVALRRGDVDGALAMLSKAATLAPDDAQVPYALGFAYLAKQHYAFAEAAFRRVLAKTPDARMLHALIAELLQRQGRHAEAADELAPLLADGNIATPALRRYAGELELVAGRYDRALPLLRAALAADPGDRRALDALVHTWRRSGDQNDARNTLDAALATSPTIGALWQARWAFARDAGDAEALVDRWLAAMPDFVPALEAQMALHGMHARSEAAEAVARRIIGLAPGHADAQARLVDGKLQRDPVGAIADVEALIATTEGTADRRRLRGWLALANDRAGRPAEALALWLSLHVEVAEQSLPLPDITPPREHWPPMAVPPADAPKIAFLFGAPGSLVERVALVLKGSIAGFRSDRFAPDPPADALQSYYTPRRLNSGELDTAAVADSWRSQLPARGVQGEVIDWLLWWDNALLAVLREQFPQALLLIALRDPRDMLLDWLAYGATAPFRVVSPLTAAAWLAIELNQIALLHEQELFPHRMLRLDDTAYDPPALSEAIGDALQTPLPAPSPDVLGSPHFAPGHWRAYADVLADAFAMLTPVARRLGYPER